MLNRPTFGVHLTSGPAYFVVYYGRLSFAAVPRRSAVSAVKMAKTGLSLNRLHVSAVFYAEIRLSAGRAMDSDVKSGKSRLFGCRIDISDMKRDICVSICRFSA